MPVISLNQTADGAQYLQYGVYRIRVNTLFAKQLVARANSGLDTVLSMETQQLQEPKLGKGFYTDFALPPYKESIHGSSRAFSLNLKHVVDNNAHIVFSGMLTDSTLSVRLFIPLDEEALNLNCCAKVFLKTAKIGDGTWKGAHFAYTDATHTTVEIHSQSDISMFTSVTLLDTQTEPMDFSGANALYFWEMFYYVPMMVFRRLLQESRFTEATQWIKYVWSPEGYLDYGERATWRWNVRPLEEETTWHSDLLDSVDPDAVSQADPMHYKVAAFMSYLDLLIARGDAAYRLLERDTLNEAKIWYVQALDLLGDEPYLA
ncbi:MAG: Unknown, probable insecticidal toxin [uncultured Paraburkholderia sp.]|nr:MAG: Unknown, probable insecticidal toxin [uncultured Paraburkholderia sp.]